MIQPQLKSIQCTVMDFGSFEPPDPTDWQITVALEIGTSNSAGGDLFYLSLCTPTWLAERVTRAGHEWGTATLVVDRWDRDRISRLLRDWVTRAAAPTWEEAAQRLGLAARWEYAPPPP